MCTCRCGQTFALLKISRSEWLSVEKAQIYSRFIGRRARLGWARRRLPVLCRPDRTCNAAQGERRTCTAHQQACLGKVSELSVMVPYSQAMSAQRRRPVAFAVRVIIHPKLCLCGAKYSRRVHNSGSAFRMCHPKTTRVSFLAAHTKSERLDSPSRQNGGAMCACLHGRTDECTLQNPAGGGSFLTASVEARRGYEPRRLRAAQCTRR